MESLTLRRRTLSWPRVTAAGPAVTGGLLALLVLGSLFLRTRAVDAGFWIDEALSVGIASHPFLDIPGVLRQDGSPPLYYLLLHGWMELFGSGETATHALSVVLAVLAVPAALWAGWTLFGRRTGWICAALMALNPFLTIYAQETRMYALMVLLSLLATAVYLHAFVYGRRRYLPVFALLLVLMLYTHNWGLFFLVGALLALVAPWRAAEDRRRLVLDAAAAFGGALLLFLPWVPTLLYQAVHTGAPWSQPPSFGELFGGVFFVLSGEGGAVAVVLAAGVGLKHVLSSERSPVRTGMIATLILTLTTLMSAWLFSQATPAWANRYLAVLVGPLLLVSAAGLARSARLGLVALGLVTLFWIGFWAPDEKSNVREVSAQMAPHLERGDLVVSTQPEQVPVLAYYLPDGFRYWTTMGAVEDPRVVDWRDALERLREARPATTLGPLLDEVPVGGRLLLVRPMILSKGAWEAPWTSLVRQRSQQWGRLLARDERFTRTLVSRHPFDTRTPRGVRAVLFTKTSAG